MSETKSVGFNLWHDPELKVLSRNAKFLWWYYVTKGLAENGIGLYVVREGYVLLDLEFTKEEYTKAREELESWAIIGYDERVEMVFIKNFLKYYPAVSKNHAISMKRSYDAIPESHLKGEFAENLGREEIYQANKNDLIRSLLAGEKVDGSNFGKKRGMPGIEAPELKGVASLMELWNKTCKPVGLPGVLLEITPIRRDKAKSRLAEHPLKWWADVFKKITENSFLCGTNKQNWKANFDWILRNPDNAIGVLEGRYGGGRSTSPEPAPQSTRHLWGICPECGKETLQERIDKYGSCETCYKPLTPDHQKELSMLISGIGEKLPEKLEEEKTNDL
jgi:uncharacterized CHY-type Zn-finger protein